MNKSVLFAAKLVKNLKPIRFLASANADGVEKESKFVPVYQFPYIRAISAINRLKIYHTAFSAAALPISIALASEHVVPNDTVWFAGCIGISGIITLYSIGYLSQRFVGIIYYDESRKVAKYSYLDFWGNRKNKEIPVEDIIPISELPVSTFDGLYLTLRQFSCKETYKFSLKFGIILDKEQLKKVL
ncbi:unnamed protein product [Brassicogethes aeneus]|uniref:Transmembrane protein 186 n=1 Tax=Brassicogethes aeneus TaxID=1431903 RepID=A0A9P0FN03_BRAAE|nr:unnamed protein product [Brassicogethes aeneus]